MTAPRHNSLPHACDRPCASTPACPRRAPDLQSRRRNRPTPSLQRTFHTNQFVRHKVITRATAQRQTTRRGEREAASPYLAILNRTRTIISRQTVVKPASKTGKMITKPPRRCQIPRGDFDFENEIKKQSTILTRHQDSVQQLTHPFRKRYRYRSL